MEKLPPSIVFDYLKGFVYKLQNDYEEMKTKLEKFTGPGALLNQPKEYNEDDENYYSVLKQQLEDMQKENDRLKQEIEVTVNEFKELQKQKKYIADAAKVSINQIRLDNDRMNQMFHEKEIEIDKE